MDGGRVAWLDQLAADVVVGLAPALAGLAPVLVRYHRELVDGGLTVDDALRLVVRAQDLALATVLHEQRAD